MKWSPAQSGLKDVKRDCGHTLLSSHKNVKALHIERVLRTMRTLHAKRVLRPAKFYALTIVLSGIDLHFTVYYALQRGITILSMSIPFHIHNAFFTCMRTTRYVHKYGKLCLDMCIRCKGISLYSVDKVQNFMGVEGLYFVGVLPLGSLFLLTANCFIVQKC